MRFTTNRAYFKRKCITICVSFFMSITALLPAENFLVYAASSDDPVVVIAVDATQESHCVETITRKVGTSNEAKQTFPCPAGSIMKNTSVRLSQAVALHKKYVRLLPTNASSEKKKSVNQQILDLIAEEAQAIHLSNKSNINPLITSCGDINIASHYWTAAGDQMYSDAYYGRLSDPNCNKLSIGSYGVRRDSDATWLWWDHVQYEDHWWGTGCPQLKLGQYINQEQIAEVNAGYYLQHWVKDNDCSIFGGTFYNDNLLLN